MIFVFRKTRSFIIYLRSVVTWLSNYAYKTFSKDFSFGRGCMFETGVVLRPTDGGRILLGDCVSIGRNVNIFCQGGIVRIGNNVHIGTGSIIVAKGSIEIGSDTLIAEYVVIRDQDHQVKVHNEKIRNSGFVVKPIKIGSDVWVGAKATVLRGVEIGDGAVIGAHALVNGNIMAGSLAAGVPAKVIKNLRNK